MPDTPKILGQSNPAATTNTDLYTVPGSTNTVGGALIACNQGATTAEIRIALVKSGEGLAAKHYLYYDLPIDANDSHEANYGLSMAAGDKIVVYASNTNVSFTFTGIEVTA